MSFKTSTPQLRRLLAHLQQLEEKTKAALARRIHDDISQKLTVLSIELSLLQKRLGANEEAKKLGELLELAGTINRSVRNITDEIRPTLLDQFGLVAALRQECKRLAALHGRTVSFETDAENVRLSSALQSEVFRLAQDLITRLAATNRGSIEVRVQAGGSRVTFEFRQEARRMVGTKRDGKLDQLTIEERADRLGATLRFWRTAKGQRVKLEVPI